MSLLSKEKHNLTVLIRNSFVTAATIKNPKTNIKQPTSGTTSGMVNNSIKYDKTNILTGSRPIWTNKIRTKSSPT